MVQKSHVVHYHDLVQSARQFSTVLSIFGVEPPWTLNHSVHCTCAMEMSWESNRVVLPQSDSLCQTVFKSFINFWCGTPLDTQSLSTLHMCNGNVLSIQSGSTTMIWLTLPDSFHICPQVLSCGFWFVQQPVHTWKTIIYGGAWDCL